MRQRLYYPFGQTRVALAWVGPGQDPTRVCCDRTQFRAGGGEGGFGSGAFGVRRPLRFLAHHLDLDEHQVAEMARILDDLKIERAQAEVDDRRTLSALADAVAAASFDEGRAGEGTSLRVGSAERLKDAVLRALRAMHAALRPEQRERFATLIRTGRLAI